MIKKTNLINSPLGFKIINLVDNLNQDSRPNSADIEVSHFHKVFHSNSRRMAIYMEHIFIVLQSMFSLSNALLYIILKQRAM